MITLLILNNLLHWVDSFYSSFMSWAISPITAIGSYIQGFYVPQTFLDIFSISFIFTIQYIIILIKILNSTLI